MSEEIGYQPNPKEPLDLRNVPQIAETMTFEEIYHAILDCHTKPAETVLWKDVWTLKQAMLQERTAGALEELLAVMKPKTKGSVPDV